MSIFIDSANLTHIQIASELGWVKGITTNPLLLAQAETDTSLVLTALKSFSSGPIFYQLTTTSFDAMIREAHQAMDILEKQLVVKLAPNELGFKVCSELSSRMSCCPTAIYSPAQALIAREAGAQYIAVYVNRASRLLGDGIQLVMELAEVLSGSHTELLAASLKSPAEAIAAFTAGAQHLTLPYKTLMAMSKHELSEEAIKEFRDNGNGLGS
jgi:transaldolase